MLGFLKSIPNPTLLGYALLACLVCTLLGVAGGAWLGMKWAKGAQAIKRVVEQDLELSELRNEHRVQLRELNQAGDRLNRISEEFERDRAAINRALDKTGAQMDKYLASRPDLAGCDLGADGLRIYIEALRPAAAPAAHPGEPDAGMPSASGAGDVGGSGRDGERRPGRPDVPPLRERDVAADRSRAGARAAGAGSVRSDGGNASADQEALAASILGSRERSP